MNERAVRDVMTTTVVHLPSASPVADAAKAMRSRQIGDVVVTEDGRVAGLVTDRDIVLRAIAEDKDPQRTPLSEILTTDLVTIDQEAPTTHAADLMRERAVRRLVVTGTDGALAGIVSIGDLAVEMDPNSALGEISNAPANS